MEGIETPTFKDEDLASFEGTMTHAVDNAKH